MTERNPIRDFLFDTSNFWSFQHQFVVAAIIQKNFPDYPQTITSKAVDEQFMRIPEQERKTIQYHTAQLNSMMSLNEMEAYCQTCELRFLDPAELQKAKDEGAALLLQFDTRKQLEDGGGKPENKPN